jgi:exosome complex exonuclease DIS3/RRP44
MLPNGNYEVGVHIADVTHFLRADSAIDKEASHRCTTVYLVDRRTDMLPGLLTEDLCSLRCKVDRLAFSVVWEINAKNGRVVSSKFGKSVIHSKASLTYQQAQDRIDDKKDSSGLTKGLRILNNVAKMLKKERNKAGALTLASTQVKFDFDQETHNPTDVTFYSMLETNSLVEEFML